MKRAIIEPTFNNQSNDAHQAPYISIKTITVPRYNFNPNYAGSIIEAYYSRKQPLLKF